MRSFISRHLTAFLLLILAVLALDALAFFLCFRGVVSGRYGDNGPEALLRRTAAAAEGASDASLRDDLADGGCWAMLLDERGDVAWSVDLPAEIESHYSLGDVARFSRGYLAGYPVFVWDSEAGLVVLGYPKGSYAKITGNSYPEELVRMAPPFFLAVLLCDLLLLFAAYCASRRAMLKGMGPILDGIDALAAGRPVALNASGDLAELARQINGASAALRRQNAARANWISGVSHDIRTPLSMILGYAGRMEDAAAQPEARAQAAVIRREAVRIRELVSDLNLTSRLEYDMQPLECRPVKLAKLLRGLVAEVTDAELPDAFSLALEVEPDAERAEADCDGRLIARAARNLIQNSIRHNPQGCHIQVELRRAWDRLEIAVRDDGVGMAPRQLAELENRPHYLESTDERLDLRHGLGLLLVRRIAQAHGGELKIDAPRAGGFSAVIVLPPRG
ncbi:MAG: HAMP domain-containing sensor histidine kinase [Clostridia bacterium]|nr:HAMP domain-containing sensor histidine kinase [Clostridia bacterium]